MFSFARSITLLSLGMYAGIGLAVILSGPAVFGALESRTAAGTAFAALLRNTTVADIVLGVVAAASAAVWLPRVQGGLRRATTVGLLALFLVTIGYYRFGIMATMQAHRQHIQTFDTPEVDTHRAAFDALHKRYERVYSMNLLVCLAAFAAASGLRRLPDDSSAAP